MDPRPQLRAALDQTQRQVDAITPAELDLATPCAEFDVRTLVAHLVAVLRKLDTVGNGGEMISVPDPAVDLGNDVVAAFRTARAALERTWTDDAKLDTDYQLPWGTMSGSELLDGYAHEFTVHAWDLAQALAHDDELDPTLGTAALAWYEQHVPAADRGSGGPFAPPAPVADDADVYARLVAFLGRPG